MPGFDRSGPQGMGPMTGGMRGACNPAEAGYAGNSGYGRGMAYGRGFGRGFRPGRGRRRTFSAGGYPQSNAAPEYPLNKADELNRLKNQAAEMKGSLDEINRRITELSKNPE